MTFRPGLVGPAAAAWAVLAAAVGCVDTAPLDYVAPSHDAGFIGDASADAALVRTCRQCLSAENGPCTADYEACTNDSRCQPALACIIGLGCFSFAQIQDKLSCSAPCIAKYDLNSQTDPAVMLLIPINLCTAGPCLVACVGP